MGNDKLEMELLADLEGTIEAARARRYVPTYFLKMLSEHGALKTVEKLLSSEKPQEGLFRLRELDLLHESLEAVVLRPKYKPLFTDQQLETARRRLEELGYPFDKS